MNAKEAYELAMDFRNREKNDWEAEVKAAEAFAQKKLPFILNKIRKRALKGRLSIDIDLSWRFWSIAEVEAVRRLLIKNGYLAVVRTYTPFELEIDWIPRKHPDYSEK